MIQQKTADRLALQNLINAYCFETQRGEIISSDAQSKAQQAISKGKALLSLNLAPLDLSVIVPIEQVSQLGQHRFADTPFVLQNTVPHTHTDNAGNNKNTPTSTEQSWIKLPISSVASLLIDDIIYNHPDQQQLDGASVLERWLQSYQGLQIILAHRSDEIDDIIEEKLNFIETEQNLIYGHAMHPTPKSRVGFYGDDWQKYAPETNSKTQLHYWLVDADFIVSDYVDGASIDTELKAKLKPMLNKYQKKLLKKHPDFKLLPLHPWQATHLQKQPWYQELTQAKQLFDLGLAGWYLHPTTSVRTLASHDADWMFKLSLSVAITNSVRINLPKECKRGMVACRIWRSDYGQQLTQQYPSIGVLNDPAWIALRLNGTIIDESICILRDNPFNSKDQVTNLASLCQDHPTRVTNRFDTLFQSIHKTSKQPLRDIALQWFDKFLEVGFIPLIDMYYEQGIGFEVHQQNSLIELEDGYPKRFWARDNQGFGYIAEYAMTLIDQYPEMMQEAECIVPEDFADFRCGYYLIGNTMFALITAIARTQLVSEDELLTRLYQCITTLEQKYPHRSLFELLLRTDTLPFKGNLLTRLYQLDELTAPVETQSIYVEIANPFYAIAHQQQSQEKAKVKDKGKEKGKDKAKNKTKDKSSKTKAKSTKKQETPNK
ncbi:IucA/IucC family protein [Psychrobacter sp. I-STPA6b]|uniref:IucA/IucC family protein n=1 Tax=Psychrobacter sp. I-STPA6b TaxID=2585718 RepID=UPI001D0C28AC|nr:IucA/IucC family protein [Psychrobacter sp. I-STPA6b]